MSVASGVMSGAKWSRRVFSTLFGLLHIVIVLVGCSDVDSQACPDRMEEFVNYQLFMGRSTTDGNIVNDADWDSFLVDIVTPRFPDGLTVLDGKGTVEKLGWGDRERAIQGPHNIGSAG